MWHILLSPLTFRILKLMLGIAVTCNNKQIFISKIQTLPERTQHALTKCVAGMMKEADTEAETEGRDSSQSINSELKAVTPPGDEVWIQKCHELDFQVRINTIPFCLKIKSKFILKKKQINHKILFTGRNDAHLK